MAKKISFSENLKNIQNQKKEIKAIQIKTQDVFISEYSPNNQKNVRQALDKTKAHCSKEYKDKKICRETRSGDSCTSSEKVCLKQAERSANNRRD